LLIIEAAGVPRGSRSSGFHGKVLGRHQRYSRNGSHERYL